MFVEHAEDGYPGMMTFVSSNRQGVTTEQKFQEGLSSLKKTIPDYKNVSTMDFTTSKGLKGIKHTYTFKAAEYDMRAVLYTFVAPSGNSVTITCGVLLQYGNKYNKIFDESVATLEFSR
jgi:hypothetical protein